MEVAGHARKDPGPAARHRLKGLACAVLVALCLWALQVARVHCSAEHGCSRSRPAPGQPCCPGQSCPGGPRRGWALPSLARCIHHRCMACFTMQRLSLDSPAVWQAACIVAEGMSAACA